MAIPTIRLMWMLLLFVPSCVLAAEPMSVFVSILPQKYLVERIGAERVTVSVMVAPGQSPATYEPTPKQVLALSRAAAYFRMGVPFEALWMKRLRATNAHMKIIDTRHGIKLRDMAHRGASPGKAQPDRQKDPHIWLSPPLVKTQARRIRDALSTLDPDHRAAYEANYRRFSEQLEQLDREIRDTLGAVKRRSFMISHPSWGYYADTYGLRQIAIEIEGKEPGAKRLAELIDLAKAEQIKVIFVQKQFSQQSANAVAQAIGAHVVVLDPLAEDVIENLTNATRSFAQALGAQ